MNKHVLVCVTGQKTCERLIVEGASLACDFAAELSVLHVVKPGNSLLGNVSEGEALEYLYKIASEHNADMAMIRADDVVSTIIHQAQKLNAEIIVLGRPAQRGSGWDLVDELSARAPDIQTHIVYS